MKLLRSTFRLAWVFLLVLFVAGCFFAPALAFGSTEIDVTSVTNRYFVDFDDYNTFVSNQVDYCDEVLATCSDVDGRLWSARNQASSALSYANNIEYRQERILADQDASSSWDQAYLSRNYARTSQTNLNACIANIDASRTSVSNLSENTLAVKSALLSSVPTYQIVVETYAGGGGCSCPDYSEVLSIIRVQLINLNTRLVTLINDYIDYEVNAMWNFWYSSERALGSPGYQQDDQHGLVTGEYFGTFLSNYVSYATSLNQYASVYGLTYDAPVHYGSPAMQEIWNWILLPYAQLLLPNIDSHNTDNRMVNAIRDFYIEPTVWVTNSYTRPLWVNMMTNGIGGSADHPILVELTSQGSHVSVDNPVWVQFTNSVYIDATSLSSITNFALDINWSPLYDLTNSVWMVTVLNSNDLAGAILDEEQRRAADAIDDMDDTSPEEETADLPSTSFGFASSLANSIKSVATSYKTMFNSIPSEPPSYITMWQGVTLYGVEVTSVHWNPSHYSACTLVRKLFSFAWYLVYIWVIFVTAAIDLCVCGVIVYMVYGLLLGKQEVAYNGMLWCFKTLASFLGYKPQSVK